MLLTGQPITAQEAKEAGLINAVAHCDHDLDLKVNDLTRDIVSKPREVIAMGKRFMYRQMEMGLTSAFKEGAKVMVKNLAYADAQEGIKAFKEKRKPKWSHTDQKV